jgi:hypothetical protein
MSPYKPVTKKKMNKVYEHEEINTVSIIKPPAWYLNIYTNFNKTIK